MGPRGTVVSRDRIELSRKSRRISGIRGRKVEVTVTGESGAVLNQGIKAIFGNKSTMSAAEGERSGAARAKAFSKRVQSL